MESSLGTYLKTVRESRGVDLSEIAVETRVPEASLKSIEEDKLDDLPGEVFVRGFLRAYAKCLGLDPGDVLARLGRPAPSPSMLPVHTTGLDLRRRRIASPAMILVLLLASLLILFVLWRPMNMPSLSIPSLNPPAGTAG